MTPSVPCAHAQASNAEASLAECPGVPTSALLPPGGSDNPPRGSLRAVLTVRPRAAYVLGTGRARLLHKHPCCQLTISCDQIAGFVGVQSSALAASGLLCIRNGFCGLPWA